MMMGMFEVHSCARRGSHDVVGDRVHAIGVKTTIHTLC